MKSNFENYIENILQQTDCRKEEKEDLSEEILIHLELSKEELMKEGMKERDAELKAIALFGSEREIGCQMQEAIFPYRKEFMLTLSIVSFFYTISVYLLSLFFNGDAHIGWLVSSMLIHSLLIFIALNQVVGFNRRRWMNGVLITHILTSLYGYMIVASLEHFAHIPLVILSWIIIILALVLIYQTTIYGVNTHDQFVKEIKILHGINLVLGVVMTGCTLFFLWVGMWLFDGFHPLILLMMVPFALWVLLYFGQMKILKKYKRIAFVLAIISVFIHVSILIYVFFPFLFD